MLKSVNYKAIIERKSLRDKDFDNCEIQESAEKIEEISEAEFYLPATQLIYTILRQYNQKPNKGVN